MDEPEYQMPMFYHDTFSVNNEIISVSAQEEYEKLCIRTEYYFCPGVSGPLMRIEITKDICVDPPEVLRMSECEVYLECDPHYYNLGKKSCITEDGLQGTYTLYCVKGFLEDGLCETNLSSIDDDKKDIEEPESKDDVNSSSEKEDASNDDNDNFVEACEKEAVDVLVIIDLSASMISEIESVYKLTQTFDAVSEDKEHVKWSLIVGPKNYGNKPGNHNYLYLASNLQSISEFQSALDEVLSYDMIGQYEMLYDALYLSLRNISSFLPYQWEELLWPVWVGNVIDESVPPLDEFYVDWRENSKKVVIVFTDEPGQSFLMPASKVGKSYNTNDTITQAKLLMMLETISDIKLYAFTDISSKESNGAWWPLAFVTSGMTFELDNNPENTLSHLEEIVSSEICF
tara:strand:- start:714 stop:1916 length:1203 start_codon:yes stop_codon:yes gene_type:complete